MPRSVHMLSCLVCLAILFLSASKVSSAESSLEMLNYYLDLVKSGNYESAFGFFTPEAQRRATRFGIEYIDIPLKIDCSSPLVRYPELAYGHAVQPISGGTRLASPDFTRFTLRVTENDTKLTHDYYAYRPGDHSWLSFAQDYWTRGWDMIQTKYFIVHYHPEVEKDLNPVVLAEADRFVEKTAGELGLDKSSLQLLEREKISYFFCQSSNMVRDITGHHIKGTYDLASDDVISAFFPHHHEITHFLVNFRLRRLHLYTQPIMREGAAVFFGGRWGKTPTSLLAMGGYIYREGVVELDSILTMSGFENSAGSDLAYPLAGLFTAFLIDRKGTDGYLEIYQQLSGNFHDLYARSVADVSITLATALGKPSWSVVRTEFDAFVTDWVNNSAAVYPGFVDGGKKLVETDRLLVTEKDGWISLRATSPDSLPPAGNLMFGMDSELTGIHSSLYETQYGGDSAFEGYRYAVRFDRNEVGLYDYATSHLLAKYIWGISPSDDYYDAAANSVQFHFKSEIVDSAPINEGTFQLLDN